MCAKPIVNREGGGGGVLNEHKLMYDSNTLNTVAPKQGSQMKIVRERQCVELYAESAIPWSSTPPSHRVTPPPACKAQMKIDISRTLG